jgi:hypothetical protein
MARVEESGRFKIDPYQGFDTLTYVFLFEASAERDPHLSKLNIVFHQLPSISELFCFG